MLRDIYNRSLKDLRISAVLEEPSLLTASPRGA